jgi:hypothetical protein
LEGKEKVRDKEQRPKVDQQNEERERDKLGPMMFVMKTNGSLERERQLGTICILLFLLFSQFSHACLIKVYI